MTDLLLKASDILVTHKSIREHGDSYYGNIEFVADGEFGDVEVSYELEFSNPVENTFYSLGQCFENVEVKFTHFSPVIDDEEVGEENLAALKTAISNYIISALKGENHGN